MTLEFSVAILLDTNIKVLHAWSRSTAMEHPPTNWCYLWELTQKKTRSLKPDLYPTSAPGHLLFLTVGRRVNNLWGYSSQFLLEQKERKFWPCVLLQFRNMRWEGWTFNTESARLKRLAFYQSRSQCQLLGILPFQKGMNTIRNLTGPKTFCCLRWFGAMMCMCHICF